MGLDPKIWFNLHIQCKKPYNYFNPFKTLTFTDSMSYRVIVFSVGIYRFRVQSGCEISVNEAKIQLVPADPFKP